jgi:predicted nucleic acid-binding protein
MPTVSNTSPVLNLALIGRLDLLREEFASVHVPPTVVTELNALARHPASGAIQTAFADGWLVPTPVKSAALVRRLRFELDDGESEAIALALELAADPVLIDEHDGRRVAAHLGLNVTGVIGILIRAKHRGLLTAIAPELDKLRTAANFFLSQKLIEQALAICGEKKP